VPFIWIQVCTLDIESDRLIFLNTVTINIDILYEKNGIGVANRVLQSKDFFDDLLKELHIFSSLSIWGEDMDIIN